MKSSAFLAGSLLLLAPAVSAAFECTTTDKNDFVSIRWHRAPIPYAVRAGGPYTISGDVASIAIENAFEAWSKPACTHMDFDYRGVVPAETSLRDVNQVIFINEDTILVDPGSGLEVRGWPHDPIAVGLTTMTYSTIDGTISHGKIELNEDGLVFVDAESVCVGVSDPDNAYDLQAVLTHEVGHFIGLAHVPDEVAFEFAESEAPTMSPSVPSCRFDFRSLQSDDTEGVCFIYPAGQRARGCDSLPAQTTPYVVNAPFSCAATGRDEAGLLLLLLVWLAWGLRRGCSRARSAR